MSDDKKLKTYFEVVIPFMTEKVAHECLTSVRGSGWLRAEVREVAK